MRLSLMTMNGTRTLGHALALAATAAVLCAAPAAAQGWIQPPPRSSDWGVEKVRTDVRVRVDGRVATVEVEEWFANRGGGLGEGVYLYPLPGEAVFSNFSLYQGDEELRGETMDADRARSIYEEIVRARRDPALIELVGHGLIRARVFPIEPGQERKITLRYTQVLERAGDALQFRYSAGGPARWRPSGVRPLPAPVPPRPQSTPGGAGQGTRPTASDVPLSFTLVADADQFSEPFSPTHALDVERRGAELRVRPESELRGDFSVFLPLARGLVGVSIAAHHPTGEDGYFMMTLSPGRVDGAATPRDITAVVDVSGSMSGEKIRQTREALHQLLGSLAPTDRFRLVAFNNRVRASGDEWARAEGRALTDAHDWVDRLEAEGGTNIAGALEEAYRLGSPADRLPIVLFLTDGLPTVGEQNPERIAAEAERGRDRARVFAFGVGYDVNTYLLDRLSAAGRGSTEYVEPGEDVETALGTLATKITHPVLTDLEVVGAPVRLVELYPGSLPDLFAGEELVVFGRYEGGGEGDLRLRGRRRGESETFSTGAAFPRRSDANDFIPRLWAARKLGELTRQVRLNGPDPELVDAIRQTALRYGLLSEYTAHLVQEPDATFAGGPGRVRLEAAIANVSPRADAAGTGAYSSPAAATGQAAVKAAESARLQREVATAADLAEAEEAMAVGYGDDAGAADEALRVVAGRTFTLVDGEWTQAGSEPERVVEIALFSDAYFALLTAAPELRPVVTALEPVLVKGERVAFRFGDDGRETLSATEAARLAAEFRGE